MKKVIRVIILLLVFTTMSFGQNMNDIGTNDCNALNTQEARLLNSLLEESRGAFDFHGKKVAFITGNSGNNILTKSQYFNNYCIPRLREGRYFQISMVELTLVDKEKSGGYDALVLSWVKIFTNRQKRKIIDKLSKGIQN